MTQTEAGLDQRDHILAEALALMSERGAHDTSMRRLAGACGLNVATLYHYFPSKADLLEAVIADRRYLEMLEADPPAVDLDAPPRARLAGMLDWLFEAAAAEEALIRLILGESLRGDAAAAEMVATLLAAIDDALERWWRLYFADLQQDGPAVARLIRSQVIAVLVQNIALQGGESPGDRRAWAEDLATLVAGQAPVDP